MNMEKFSNLIEQIKEYDSIFGLYVSDIKKELAVNGGDWVEDEVIDIIETWANTNGFTTVWEAEVDDEYFTDQGYTQIY